MGLVSVSGQGSSVAAQELQDGVGTPTIPYAPAEGVATNPTPTPSDVLQNNPSIRDPALDRLTFDTSQYITTLKNLQGYNKGTRVTCIYFQQLNENWNRRSNTVDTPTMRNNLSVSYRRINDYEITIPEPWEYEFDKTSAGSSLKGTAMLYPGMNPKVGDIFYASIGDGKLGMFKVSDIRPTTWFTQTAYEISYFLFDYASSIDVFPQQAATVITVNFVKDNYLGQTSSLLTQDKADDLQTLSTLRDYLGILFYRKFYNTMGNTLYIPGTTKLYDPYVVKFVNLILPYSVVKTRAAQLYPNVDLTYDNTIWSTLNSILLTDLTLVIPFYRSRFHRVPNLGVGVTSITNRPYLVVDEEARTDYTTNTNLNLPQSTNGEQIVDPADIAGAFPLNDYYVFTNEFYEANLPGMTALEQLTWKTITTRVCTDTQTLITLAKAMKTSTVLDQFYHIPVIIKLIDIASSTITNAS